MKRFRKEVGLEVCLEARLTVIVDGDLSASRPLVFGVPQGSALEPVLFTLYSQPLSDVLSARHCGYHKYAELSKSAPLDQFYAAQSCV